MSANVAIAPETTTTRRREPTSFFIFLGMMGFVVLAKILLALIPTPFTNSSQTAVFTWPAIVVFAAAGLLGVLLSQRIGLPAFWEGRNALWQRLGLPIVIGIILGAVILVLQITTHFNDVSLHETGVKSVDIPLPTALYVYPAAAVLVEILYRLLPVPLLVWGIGNVILRGRFHTAVFWVVAALVATLEPLSQSVVFLHHPEILIPLSAFIYGVNLVGMWLFWRYGFVAALLLRIGFYLVWHLGGAALHF